MPSPTTRVVISVQENHTTDNYFRAMAAYGANVSTGWPTAPNPPAADQPHDRTAYFKWLTKQITGNHTQFDTAAVIPFYLYLATTGAFLENHCTGFGTNSSANHMLVVGGQSPTLKNPSFSKPPSWDLPSVPGLAQEHGLSWRCYAGTTKYPFAFYNELKASPNIVPSAQFATDAKAGTLPALCYLYHDTPLDEHPPADVTVGHNAMWQAVTALVAAGQWEQTVWMLTWDDWGGYDDHVATPAVEYTPDNVQLAYGPRVGLLMFGGRVRRGIDSRWCSHVSLAKTAIQLLGLPPLGVPRVDQDAGLADLVVAGTSTPPPPAFGTPLRLPPPGPPKPVGPVILRGGKTLPAPNDVKLPKQPHPPA